MKTAIVIPAYYEEKRIASVVKGVRKTGYQWVIVVDDGSDDATAALAKEAGAEVLRHIINRGQGAALRTGIHYAYDQGADIIVTFDADGQHQPEDIAAVITPIKRKKADIVFGSRFLGKAINMDWSKRLVLKTGVIVTWIFSGIKLTDSHNGFRALNRTAAKRIEITFDKMEHASEFVEEVARKRLRHVEVPVTIVYHERGQHPLRSIKMGVKLVLRKVLGW